MNLVCKNYSVCVLGLRANSGMLENSEEMSDARTLRFERRELQARIDCFVTSVFSPDTSDKNEPSQSAYDTLKSNLITLDNNASHVLQEGDELRDFCDKLKKLGQLLDDAYRCWCDNTVTSPPTATLNREKSHDIEPHDSVSNVGSGFSHTSLTPSQLAHKQIDLDLERQRLEAEFEAQQARAEAQLKLKLSLAELQAKEKRLALSNSGSVVSRRSLPVKVLGQNLSVPRHPQSHAGILQTQMGEQKDATFSHYLDHHMPSSSHQLTNTSREILTTEPPRTAIGHLDTSHCPHQPITSLTQHAQFAHTSHTQENVSDAHCNENAVRHTPQTPPGDLSHNEAHAEPNPLLTNHTQHHSLARTQPLKTQELAVDHNNVYRESQPAHDFALHRRGIYAQNNQSDAIKKSDAPHNDHRYTPSSNNTQTHFHDKNPHISPQEYQLLLEEAREIRFTGKKLPFIFYYNQIIELLDRCPDRNRKMDLLRASCQEEAREAVATLVPLVPGWGVDKQIQRALEGLRLRYGCNSFLSEPLVKRVRSGPKLHRIDLSVLETLISDLNDCELYARAHKQIDSLDSSFIIDIGERLPNFFKNRYADYLQDRYHSLDKPTFDSFKSFLNRELERINSTFAQRFLGLAQDRSDKSHAPVKLRVHQASLNVKTEPNNYRPSPVTQHSQSHTRQPPVCFICSTPSKTNRHLLNECNTYRNMTLQQRYDNIKTAGHCINCLQQHDLKDCIHNCKCRHCGKHYQHKHTTSLHALYTPVFPPESAGSHGAATSFHLPAGRPRGAASFSNHQPEKSRGAAGPSFLVQSADALSQNDARDVPVKKQVLGLHTRKAGVLTRISAIRVINPQTGNSLNVYAQHDSGSEVTIVSDSLVNKLGLKSEGSSRIILHTVTERKESDFHYVSFDVEALHNGDHFNIQQAWVMNNWSDDSYTLPHDYDLSEYSQFDNVEFEVLPDRKCVDILLGLDNSHVMTALKERTGRHGEPHAIKTPIGWVASGGSGKTYSYHSMRVSVNMNCESNEEKILELQQVIRDMTLENDETQLSRSDREAQQIVDGSNTTVVDGRYQMPVPFKENVKDLPYNFPLAAKRLSFLRRRMLLHPEYGQVLTEAITELRQNEFIKPADRESSNQINYLPYFLTTQSKPRVVYDGSATYEGRSINSCIHSGPDLLNSLANVLAKFRMGQYALMADITKCFFQISLPQHQQDLFQILWYKDDDISKGELQPYKFTRHVWGIVSSPYIACAAIRKTAEENPTNASSYTTDTIRNCMYMDDLLFSTDTLDKA